MDAKERLLALVEFDDILSLDPVVSRHKERLEGLALELFLLLSEIVLNLRLLDGSEGVGSLGLLLGFLGLRLLSIKFGILGLDGEKASVLLVPEGLNWDSIGTHFKLHEVVHINVVNVDLGVRDGDRWEWDLVRKDRKFLAVRVKCDFLDLPDLLPVLDLKLSSHAKLLVLAPRNIKDLDERLGGDNSHELATGIDLDHLTFLLCQWEHLFDLARVAANFKAVLLALND